MELNQNYPWYLQTSPNFVALYDGMFNVAKNFSSLDVYKVFYPEVMAEQPDAMAASYGLKVYASLWQIPTEFSAIIGALIYDVGDWSDVDKWSGDATGASIDWFLRYIKMKTFINNQPISLQLIHDALDILFGDVEHDITVTETQNAITVNITTDSTSAGVLQGILATDPTLVGKPMGATITYSLI